MRKKRLRFVWFLLVLFGLVMGAYGCDELTVASNVLESVNEIRYHRWTGDHCETIRLIIPAGFKVQNFVFLLSALQRQEAGEPLSAEEKRALEAYQQALQVGLVVNSPQGTFRFKPNSILFGQSKPTSRHWSRWKQGQWQPTDQIPEAFEKVRDAFQYTFEPTGIGENTEWGAINLVSGERMEYAAAFRDLGSSLPDGIYMTTTAVWANQVFRLQKGVLDLWDEECLPREIRKLIPTPTPGPTPTFSDLDYGESLGVMAPTPTPYAIHDDLTVPLTFHMRPGQGDPCTKVTFHLPADAQGRPDLTRPFEISFFKGYLRYRVNLPPDSIAALDEAFPKQSPTAFQSMLAQAVSTSGAARMYFVNEWMSIEGSDRPLTDSLNPKGPLVQALYRLWAYRMGRANWWQAQGVAWSAPDCGPRPTPTPTPPLVGQAATATPTPYEVAGVMTTPTPAVGGAPTPVPVAQATPTPQPTPSRPPVCGTASDCTERSDLGRAAFDSLNQLRQENGLPPLRWNNALYRAALEQARHMAATGQVTHQDCNGQYADSRVVKHGYIFRTVVENVGDSPPSTQIVILWQNSSGHLQNMLNTDIVDGAVAFCCVGGRCYVVFVGGSPP